MTDPASKLKETVVRVALREAGLALEANRPSETRLHLDNVRVVVDIFPGLRNQPVSK